MLRDLRLATVLKLKPLRLTLLRLNDHVDVTLYGTMTQLFKKSIKAGTSRQNNKV